MTGETTAERMRDEFYHIAMIGLAAGVYGLCTLLSSAGLLAY